MRCPKCGQELVPSKKDPECMLCYDCKKKYRIPQKKKSNRDTEEQKYANIPPKHVRDKREKEMKKAYTQMLSVEEEVRKKKRPRKQEPDDDYYDFDDYDDKVSKAPVIILAIIILIVAALIIYMLKFR